MRLGSSRSLSGADIALSQMFPSRMAWKQPVYGVLSLLVLSCSKPVLAIRLPDEISRLIPACAQDCFITFLVFAYGTDIDGDIPSLSYLCSNYGDTEWTVGEGAVQCLVAEKSTGGCSQKEAGDTAISKAHQMCSAEPNAIEPTHGVITATLELPPPGVSGPVSFPSPQSTQMRSRMRTTHVLSKPTQSSSVIETTSHPLSSPSTSETSIFTTSIRTSRTQSSSTATTTPTAVPAAAGNDSKGSLTTGQKAGISVGVVAFAGLAIALLFLLRYYRRKNNGNTGEHQSESTEALHKRDTWGYKVDKNGSSVGNSWMVRPGHRPIDSNSSLSLAPRAYNRDSWRPSAIGLAITPTQPRPTPPLTPPRRVSKLLPAKPVLALGIPQRSSPLSQGVSPLSQGTSPSPQRQLRVVHPSPSSTRNKPHPPLPLKLEIPQQDNLRTVQGGSKLDGGRESAMTEFEEDGKTAQSPEGQIWRPPSMAPQSTTTYYVADKYGNWVLGDPKRISHVAELDAVTPMTSSTPKPAIANAVLLPVAQRAHEVESKSPRLRQEPKDTGATPPDAVKGPEQPKPTSPEVRQQAMPRPLFSANPNPRHSASAYRSSGRSLTRPRVTSADSGVTTFTTSSEAFEDYQPPAPPPPSLSPVAESPRGASGRSPVSYPRIHGRNGGPAAAGKPTIVAPPQRPILLHPPGQPSPTLGLQLSPPPTGSTLSSYNVPRAGGRGLPTGDPALPRTGSPTVRLVEPSPSPPQDDRSQLPSARHRNPSVSASSPPPQQPRPQLLPSPFPPEEHGQERWRQQYQEQQAQQQRQREQQPQEQQQHHHHYHPNPSQRQEQAQYPRQPMPNWVPGLPAHPHPQRRPHQTNAHWHPQQRYYQQYHYQHHQPQLRAHPPLYPDPYQRYPQPHHRRQQSAPTLSNIQQQHPPSHASLIAKRLGTDRAAGMAISTSVAGDANPSSHQPNWRRGSGGPFYVAPVPVTPRQQVPGNLPATPTWEPRLTPSRRGDDLYLNVH